MGNTHKYLPTIGLEVHIQLATKSKIFCADKNEYGAEPNTNISEISLAHPGTLPKLNRKAVEYAIRMGLACKSQINQRMFFDRKNYFYPDLPKGYQLTQDKTPICVGGQITITNKQGEDKTIVLTKIHLEEDAGKLNHDVESGQSNVDFNRAGVPLIELVTEPMLHEPDDAALLMAEIRKMVRYLEISTGDMEKGSLRCDANVSVALEGAPSLGSKVEIKNMNSFKHVKKAIVFEIERQVRKIEAGEQITVETRLYDVQSGKTFEMRTKEELNDYRYFPEPDLCPFEIADEWLASIKESMPLMPGQLIKSFVEEYGIPHTDAVTITESKQLATFYHKVCRLGIDARAASNWIIGPVKSYLNEKGREINETTLGVNQLAELISLVQDNKVSFSKASSEILPGLFKDANVTATAIADQENLLISSNENDLQTVINSILAKFPHKVKAYQNGKKGLLGFFMGELMKETKGRVDPKEASCLMEETLTDNT